jgi:hypothetical protein
MRTLSVIAGLTGALLLAACDDGGPSGPGAYTVRVENSESPPSGAVLELYGKGITGVSSSGSTRVFSVPLTGRSGVRVVAVNPLSGPVEFRIEVKDLGRDVPRGEVLEATDAQNLPSQAVSRYKVRVFR